MTEKQKILVCGDVCGKFSTLFERVNTVNKKSGPFDFVLCVGNFFGSDMKTWAPYKDGQLSGTVSTYVLGPCKEEDTSYYLDINGCELAQNITYLGKRGVFTLSNGLKIAYLSGVQDDSNISDACRVTKNDVNHVRDLCTKNSGSSCSGVDILLTSSWPEGVTKFDSKEVVEPPFKSSLVSELSSAIKPRYHFCSSLKKYYERAPYRNINAGDAVTHVTRFIALPPVGNADKEKWLYAFSILPIQQMKPSDLTQQTTDTTECPYTAPKASSAPQYFYDMSMKNERKNKRKMGTNQKVKRHATKTPLDLSIQNCWFCLANPRFEKHLVITIGTGAYVSLAKGPLIDDHVLIVPMEHDVNYHNMAPEYRKEIENYKKALRDMYKSENKVPVFFERHFISPHMQIQVVPIPEDRIQNVKRAFTVLAKEKGMSFFEIPGHVDLTDVVPTESSYFFAECGDDRLLHVIDRSFFPLQFGREVLASSHLLDIPNKVDWKACDMTKEEETALVLKLRSKLENYID